MRNDFINIPGTTLLIKADDLIYSRLQCKVLNQKEIVPPVSSEEEFGLVSSDEIVFSIDSEYHSMIHNTDGTELKDEIVKVSAVVETLVFNTESTVLTDTPAYLLLDEEPKGKVDNWIHFYRRNIKWQERLLDLQEEQSEETRRNNLAVEEMGDLALQKNSITSVDAKIKALFSNLEEDSEKHETRMKSIAKRILTEKTKIVYSSTNAYDICGWLRDNVDNSDDTFVKLNTGIASWVNFIKSSLGHYDTCQSAYGLNFISRQNNIDDLNPANKQQEDIYEDDDGSDSNPGTDHDFLDESSVSHELSLSKNLSLEEEANLSKDSRRPYTIKLDGAKHGNTSESDIAM